MKEQDRTIPAARIVLIVALAGVVAACTPENDTVSEEVAARRTARSGHTLTLVYPPWSSEFASAHLVQAVLQERLGYRVELEEVSAEEMWRRVATDEADILAGAWLPVTHREYLVQYGPNLDDLGPNLEGARIGLVVPAVVPGWLTDETGRTGRELVPLRRIEELGEHAVRFNRRIIGIESGAGIMTRTEDVMRAYDLDGQYRLVESHEREMLARVSEAVRREEWIVFTGWTPHWIFERYNLRFLEDSLGVYGGEEAVHTMVRPGLADEYPEVRELLARLNWSPEDLERLMVWIRDDESRDAYRQALRWMRVNRERVDRWVQGLE